MDRKRISIKKIILIMLLSIILIGIIYGWHEYKVFTSPPKNRLAAGSVYPEMPADDHHVYIQLPIDHSDPALGTFTDFYLLSPSFKPGDNVVFILFDNQQEAVGMVNTAKDFEYYDDMIGSDMPYVLIGNRGVSPTLFPEVFKPDGSPDYAKALKLYGSQEQIEDIEAVRQDMAQKGLLGESGKIMLLGGSGGGVLIQQYIEKYGDHVSRALIESTSAVDLAQENNLTFAKNLYDSNPAATEKYYALQQEKKTGPSLAWTLFKLGLNGDAEAQTNILNGQDIFFDWGDKFLYWKNWLKLPQNFPLVNFIMDSPQELEVKVRMWELLGSDLVKYDPQSAKDINLMYETTKVFLSNFLDAYDKKEIAISPMSLDRSKFQGEVMVWANTGDQDFGPERAKLISDAYPHSKLVIFEEKSHHLQKISAYQEELIKSFFENGLTQ